MEKEKIIIESSNSYKKVLKRMFLINFIILAVIGIAALCFRTKGSEFLKKGNAAEEAYYRSVREHDTKRELELEREYYHDLGRGYWGIYWRLIWLGGIALAVFLILLIFYLYLANTKMVITDKSVYGKAVFGKRVVLPLDAVSAVAATIFKGLAVATSSGKIKFKGLSNRDDLHKTLSDLLVQRQSTKKVTIEGNNIKSYLKVE